MINILKQLSAPLAAHDVELRIGTTNAKGFSLLLYKTARTDVRRLNQVCGLRWQNSHYNDSNGNVVTVGKVYDDDLKEWIVREDVGTESHTEKEKGSYSDSFKRVWFRFGIGLELYNSPFIWINWEMKKKQSGRGYDPVNFYPSKLEVSDYQVINGEPKLSITYNKQNIFSNIFKTQSKSTEDEKKQYWAEFTKDCKSVSVDPMEFLEWALGDTSDKKQVQNIVSKYLKDKEMFFEQLDNYKTNKGV